MARLEERSALIEGAREATVEDLRETRALDAFIFHELLGGDESWDTGVTPRDGVDMLADLRVRMWLARSTRSPLVLMRPVLAAAPDPEALVKAIDKSLRVTTRSVKRGAAVG